MAHYQAIAKLEEVIQIIDSAVLEQAMCLKVAGLQLSGTGVGTADLAIDYSAERLTTTRFQFSVRVHPFFI